MKRRWILPAVAALAALIPFLPALSNGFVIWDDKRMLLDNLGFRGLSWAHIGWMLSTFLGEQYHPLTWLSYAVDYRLWGLAPFGFHLTNLLIHAGNAALVFFVAEELYCSAGLRGERDRAAGAIFAALLFAAHPLRVESVAWTTERRGLLAGFFFLTTILLYLRAVKLGRPPRAAWATFALCLLSKASGIALPAVLVLLDIYPLRRLPPEPRRWFSRQLSSVWREKVPFVLLSAAAAVLGTAALASSGRLVEYSQFSLEARLAQAAYQLGFYLCKTLWPAGLSPLYERSYLLEPEIFWFYGAVAAAAAWGALATRRRWPAFAAALMFYLWVLTPVLGLAKSSRHTAADRYTYLPCLGLAILAGGLVAVETGAKSRRRARALALCAAVSATALLGTLSWRQTAVWHDSVSLWERAIAVEPGSYFSHQQLAAALEEAGRGTEAEREGDLYRRLLAQTYRRAAAIYSRRGDRDKAALYLRRALEALGR